MSMPVTNRMVIEAGCVYVANPRTWDQGTLATNSEGREVQVTDAFAYRFCGMGALYRAAFELVGIGSFNAVARRAIVALGGDSKIIATNDFDGREAVLALFDDYLARNPA